MVITRQDINPGYQCVQSSHAIADFSYEYPDIFNKWKEESNSIICLSAKSEKNLLKLFEKFSQLTPGVKFFEPDVNEWTSICLYGTPQIRKSLSYLPLTLKKLSPEL